MANELVCCLCFATWIVLLIAGLVMLFEEDDTTTSSPTVLTECKIIGYFSSVCLMEENDERGYYFMYRAISNKTCGMMEIKSIKSECVEQIYDDDTYLIGDNITCWISDCYGFFKWDKSQLSDEEPQQHQWGITLLIMAGIVCCGNIIFACNTFL